MAFVFKILRKKSDNNQRNDAKQAMTKGWSRHHTLYRLSCKMLKRHTTSTYN